MSDNNTSWDLIEKIATSNNQGAHSEMYSTIANNDFSDKPQAAEVALLCIALTPTSIERNKECLLKFTKQVPESDLSWRAKVRFKILRGLLDLDSNNLSS